VEVREQWFFPMRLRQTVEEKTMDFNSGDHVRDRKNNIGRWIALWVMMVACGCALQHVSPDTDAVRTLQVTDDTPAVNPTQTPTSGFSPTFTVQLTSMDTPIPPPISNPDSSSGAVSIALGRDHACAKTEAGGVKCWGNNDHGQLGDGTIENSNRPVYVTGLMEGVKALSAGVAHACAITSGGSLKCWGANARGQLGNDSTADSSIPVDVSGLTGEIYAVAAGGEHTCAVTTSGDIACWGSNDRGQLGDGGTTDSAVPVWISGETEVWKNVAAGTAHTCALSPGGGMHCWGTNELGQLGDGKGVKSRSVPEDVVGLQEGAASLSASGDHTCVLMATTGVRCWGNNQYGQLGDGTNTNRFVPVDLLALGRGVDAVAAGANHSCAMVEGVVKCWGWNYHGQLGDGMKTTVSEPKPVGGVPADLTAVAAGGDHTCALTARGGVICWGRNEFGQLGDGTTFDSAIPVDVKGLQDPLRVSELLTLDGEGPVAFSSDGQILALASDAGINLYDAVAWKKIPLHIPHRCVDHGLVFYPDGKSLLCGTADQISRWDIVTRERLFSIRGMAPIALSPDGTRMACSSISAEGYPIVKLADALTGMELRTIAEDHLDISYLRAELLWFSLDGKMLITLDDWDGILLWDVSTGQKIQGKGRFDVGGYDRVFSPDMELLVVSYIDAVIVYDFKTRKRLKEIDEETGVTGLSFSPDGKIVVMVHRKGKITFWNVADWTLLYSIQSWRVLADVSFSPDGSQLVITSNEGVSVWGLAP
jgi:alpha-tubulin suppressor-like RCC1 family protein